MKSIFRRVSLSVLACAAPAMVVLAPSHAEAQRGAASQLGTVERNHPYLADVLNAFDATHGMVLQAIMSGAPAGGEDARVYERLVRGVLTNPDWGAAVAADESRSAGSVSDVVPSRVVEALERANAFRRDLLEIYADPDATSPYLDVQQAVREYRADPETAFLTDPKDMMIIEEGPQTGAFAERYPRLHGLMWAHRWLQLAAFEPLIRYQTPERRRAGVMAVVARFWTMLENPPESLPREMPMAPTIAPALVAFHPDAAAILDNANLFHDMVTDLLVSEEVDDPAPAMEQLLAGFQDPEYFWTSWYDWNRMAILHGVGNQGGWATGIIPDPRRTEVDLEGEHGGHMVIPGMPAGGM